MSSYKYDMADMTTYSLEELGKLTSLSPRTIRSYIQKGLLPGAETRGRNASYTDAHLDRLRCMQVIRDKSGLPLDELRMVMQSLSEEQIHRIGSRQEDVMALPIGRAVPAMCSSPAPGQMLDTQPNATRGPGPLYSPGENTNALDYIRQIRSKTPSHESRFAELIRILEDLTDGRRVYRKSKNEWWATVKVTEDMEIRVRGLDEKDIGQLERLADLLRHVLMKGV
jgi:DNA-binding transcriptional MerR regulator